MRRRPVPYSNGGGCGSKAHPHRRFACAKLEGTYAITRGARMEAYKQEFIKFMVESDVLKFGSFTLKSGRQSDRKSVV